MSRFRQCLAYLWAPARRHLIRTTRSPCWNLCALRHPARKTGSPASAETNRPHPDPPEQGRQTMKHSILAAALVALAIVCLRQGGRAGRGSASTLGPGTDEGIQPPGGGSGQESARPPATLPRPARTIKRPPRRSGDQGSRRYCGRQDGRCCRRGCEEADAAVEAVRTRRRRSQTDTVDAAAKPGGRRSCRRRRRGNRPPVKPRSTAPE